MKTNWHRYGVRAMLTMVWALAASTAMSADAPSTNTPSIGPHEMVDKVVHSVLGELSAHRDELRKHPSEVRGLVDKLMLPHFDTEFAAKQVLAQHWRMATPEQRQRFIQAFYQSLVQNYGEALLDFTADRIVIFPLRADPGDKNVTIRTTIRRDNGTLVPVNYTLHIADGEWKAWDVTIEGVSYVKSFRTDFSTEIDQRGLDEVIKRLETHQISPGKKSQSK